MKFKALMNGTVNAVAINQRLRALWDAFAKLQRDITELQKAAGIVPAAISIVIAEKTTPESSPAIIEPVAPVFDWQKSDDVDALKAFALKELNLSITGNKGAPRIRADIADFLTLNAEK